MDGDSSSFKRKRASPITPFDPLSSLSAKDRLLIDSLIAMAPNSKTDLQGYLLCYPNFMDEKVIWEAMNEVTVKMFSLPQIRAPAPMLTENEMTVAHFTLLFAWYSTASSSQTEPQERPTSAEDFRARVLGGRQQFRGFLNICRQILDAHSELADFYKEEKGMDSDNEMELEKSRVVDGELVASGVEAEDAKREQLTEEEQLASSQRQSEAAITNAQSNEKEKGMLKDELGTAKEQLALLESQKAARLDSQAIAELGETQVLREELHRAKADIAILEAKNRVLELLKQKAQKAQRTLAARLDREVVRSRGEGWQAYE